MTIRQFACFALALLLLTTPARAGSDMNILRDAETEGMLYMLAKPIFEAAGLNPDAVNFVLVQNSQINAFVAGGSNMFIYTGLLKAARTPDELIGVIAHETGHISGGHLVRLREEMRNASATAILTTLAGIAAAAASRDGSAGIAAISLGQSVAERNLLQYSRTQESAADQAALTYLRSNQISPAGLRDFLTRLQDQELLPSDQQSEFVRTHPLTRERVEAVIANIDANGQTTTRPLPAAYTEAFNRVRSKLDGYIDPRGTLQRTSATATDFATRYARALASHLTGDTRTALELTDKLLREEPGNAYLYELKGQILFESGRVTEAVEPYRKAVSLSGGNALLRVGLAQALLNRNDAASMKDAVTELETAITRERGSPLLWRLLATAYGRQNQLGMAAYALSEEALARGNKALASQHAKRAQGLLQRGSSGWIKAGDVLAAAESKED